TIANGGYRVRPHFLKEIRMPNASGDDRLGSVYRSVNTDILNRVQMPKSQIERVQEGFRQAYQEQSGTAYSYFTGKDYNPAGKTENRSLIGYAPHDEPEVAFAIIAPYLSNSDYAINNYIGEGILDAYFELKEKRDLEEEDAE